MSRIERLLDKYLRKTVITRDDEHPYLIRWSFRFAGLGFKIHKILLSDDACLHDHPWAFFSIILRRGYTEYYLPPQLAIVGKMQGDMKRHIKKHRVGVGRILYRPAHFIHRLEVDETKPTWTFVITFKPVREWGFWTMAGEFIWWKRYIKQDHCDAGSEPLVKSKHTGITKADIEEARRRMEKANKGKEPANVVHLGDDCEQC